MAQRVQVLLIDDLDGSAAAETVKFSLDNATYEIDLSAAHAKELRTALNPWIGAGRRAPGRAARASAHAVSAAASGETAKIRAWAVANGHVISARGRIPGPIREAYHAAH
ncbi:MAG: Lsr2 family protein [Bifidobacteriaceae bacterium]|jgi:hypothetical protein|nr:Lsr2 family protein [Bifidobacteriaceae bacterium]